ncbi:hypothetical protein D9611_009671 [Ephemerocybe angulata]|uniref:Uncharacterized protein n=1 Tax=Ephemerocybe angulata TaxID=980116 RepID=A0A8H5C5U3_9AGAR|nr:hypothetical protein D9611_009671 [Tulosesus angulatus]
MGYGRSADEFLSCLRHPDIRLNASARPTGLRRSPRSHEQSTSPSRQFQQLERGLSGLKYAKSSSFHQLTTTPISHTALGGRNSVASSPSRRPECQRDTQIPEPIPHHHVPRLGSGDDFPCDFAIIAIKHAK